MVRSPVILQEEYVTVPPDPDADILVGLRMTLRTPSTAVPGGEMLAVEFKTIVMNASCVTSRVRTNCADHTCECGVRGKVSEQKTTNQISSGY